MKTIKIIIAVILCILGNTTQTFAQQLSDPPISINGNIRTQLLNQYTDVFVSSPNSGTVIQEVHNDDSQIIYANSDRFFIYSQAASNYVELQQDGGHDIMQPGVGYVLQIGGNGNHGQTIVAPRDETFTGSPNTTAPITVAVTNGSFCLLGNPYNGFLNLDAFLMNPLNKTKVRGPILLWSHNTIVSANNDPSPDPSPLRFSANDYAMYNVLGGVAAGRSISTSAETNGLYSTGIQTPNGTICMGTGFGVRAIGTGDATFTPAMISSNNGSSIQSFRPASVTNTANTLENEEKNTLSPPPPPGYRHRIWINMEEGFPPPPNTPSITPLRQLLIGYVACSSAPSNPYSECATAGETDRIFDCRTVATLNPRMEFYSISNAPANPLLPLHLAIQGRSLADYTDSDFFQLDYIAPVGGTYTFTTSSDGMFATKKYYVLDAMAANPLLRNPFPYTFTTSATDVPKRFKVVFESQTNLVNACGTQIASVWNVLFSNQITGATSYKYQVATNSSFSAGSIVGVFDGNVPANFRPYQFCLNIPGLIAYNTTYWIRVATYQVAGIGWAYGPICQVTTPALPPTIRLTDDANGNCNKTVSNFNNSLFANSPSELGFTANGWRFEVRIGSPTGPTVGDIVERTTSGFSLALLRPSYQPLPGTVYYVRVQIRFGNAASGFVWQLDNLGNPNYGPTCTVTTTANATGRFAASGLQTTDFEANVYPNPFATNFKLEITPSSDSTIGVKVYDMVGRLIEERLVLVTEIDAQEVGDKYPTGVYTIVISQGENIKTLRVIKR